MAVKKNTSCLILRMTCFVNICKNERPIEIYTFEETSGGVRRSGSGGFSPHKFWISRVKNMRFLSFEAHYRMYFHVNATSNGRTILSFFHVCSECIPTGTTSSRKEAGNWLENLRTSQGTPGCCRASEKKLSTTFVALVTKILPTVS